MADPVSGPTNVTQEQVDAAAEQAFTAILTMQTMLLQDAISEGMQE